MKIGYIDGLKWGKKSTNGCCGLHKYLKVKQSRNRPGVAQSVPGGLGSQIS